MTLALFSASSDRDWVMGVTVKDGQTALQEMPYLPPSLAMALVRPLTPALEVA